MTTDTRDRILQYIKERGAARPDDLANYLGFSPSAVHRQLNKLLYRKLVERVGKPPKVYYRLALAGLQAQISQALSRNPKIISAYILGSSLSGNTNQESDFDLAVVVKHKSAIAPVYDLIKNIKFPRDLDLSVVDKSSSPLFLFQIVSTGKRIFEKSFDEALAFEDFSLHNYYDTAHLRHLDYLFLKEKFSYAY